MVTMIGTVLILCIFLTSAQGFEIDSRSYQEASSTTSSRSGKLLFNTGVSLEQFNELRNRLEKLESEFQARFNFAVSDSPNYLENKLRQVEAESQVNFTTTFNNITNLYNKVKALRAANALKCSKTKCEKTRAKVKRINKDLEFLKNLNVTQLQEDLTTISNFQTTVTNLETSVNTLNENATKQQEEIDTVKTSVTTIETTVTNLQTSVTSNTEKVTKVNNCFADINSADCPSARLRSDRVLDEDVEIDVGPHPSDLLRNIFRANRGEKTQKIKKKNKKKNYNQLLRSTTPLIPNLKIILACMEDNTASTCTAKYSSSSSIPVKIASVSTLSTDMTTVKSCLTDPSSSACTGTYSAATTLPAVVTSLSTDVTPIKACLTNPSDTGCTGTYSASTSLPASVSSLSTDVSPIKACMTNPTDSGCTGTYSAATTLPATLSTVSTDVTPIKACMTNPSDAGCTGTYSASTSMPVITAGVSTLTSDVTTVKACLTNPADSGCTGTYSAATTMPSLVTTSNNCFTNPADSSCTSVYSASTTLPQVLAGKCSTSTCTTLNTDMTTVKACLTDPSASSCTTDYSAATTLPAIVKNTDKCMKDVSDSTCTSTYGASSYLITSGGKGMVGYIEQLNKPSSIWCVMTADITTYADSSGNNGCTPKLANWKPMTWTCTQMPQQDTSKNSYYMQPDTATGASVITINQAGYYKIELTALMSLNKFQHRVEVFKKSSGATCDFNTVILALNAQDETTGSSASIINKKRSSNVEGIFSLAAADELIVIASTSGSDTSTTNPNTKVEGDSAITKTSWIITRLNY